VAGTHIAQRGLPDRSPSSARRRRVVLLAIDPEMWETNATISQNTAL
jgi:hypothetical protein